ncbi:MAG: O-antigen ligase family protein, partial [Anaerolineales bacterium]
MPKLSLDNISRLLWALVLVTLPVTSFRYVPFMGDGTYVRPLAIYPLALLWPVLLIRLKQGKIARPWPGALTVVLAFALAALAATVFGGLLAPLPLRGADYFDRAIRALLTVGIGLAFFVAAIWMNQSEADLKFSVKWLLAGLALDLAWSAAQFIGLNTGYRQQLIKIQNLFSVRGLVQNKRASGFAFEPSWLAGQLAALYLPWLFAALLSGYRIFTDTEYATRNTHYVSRVAYSVFRMVGRWIEPVLLLGSLACLLITYSRSGLATVVLAALFTFVVAGRETASAFWGWVRAGFNVQRWTSRRAAIKAAGSRVLLAGLAVAVLAGATVFLADKGYIAALFKSQKEDLFSYAVDAYLGPRLAYSAAAMDTFQESPWLGVGLGASGFTMYNHMPDWALAGVPEIAQQLSPDSRLYPNPKDLYARLLAETGLLGFALFVAFYLALLADALGLLHGRSAAARWLAMAALFTFAAVVLQGFSQDSFAMPEMWVNLGMLAGAAAVLK